MSQQTAGQSQTANDFIRLLRGWVASVTVISARTAEGKWQAMTASSFTPVAVEPPTLLVCVNRQAGLYAALNQGQPFCVNLLSDSQQSVAAVCSDKDMEAERFQQAPWSSRRIGGQEVPYLTGAQGRIFCRCKDSVQSGTHGIFVGEVVEAAYSEAISPLLYVDRAYRKLAPAGGTQI